MAKRAGGRRYKIPGQKVNREETIFTATLIYDYT